MARPVMRRRSQELQSTHLLAQAWVEILRLRRTLSKVAFAPTAPSSGGGGGGGGGGAVEAGAHALYGSKHTRALLVTAGPGLSVIVDAGQAWVDGVFYDIIASQVDVADDDTNYVFIDTDGSPTSNTTGFPDGSIPLAEVVMSSGIATIADRRAYPVALIPAGDVSSHLADADDAHDASAISVLDVAGDLTADNVEDALAELFGLIGGGDVSAHLADTDDAHDASAISADSTTLVGTGTNVQAVLEELDDAIAAAAAALSTLAAIDFLVGTASGALSGEIAVGATPGGELGGTWAAPTVDATHSGSTHTDATDAHIADATDAHDASAVSVDSTDLAGVGTDVQTVLEELDDAIEAILAALVVAIDDLSDVDTTTDPPANNEVLKWNGSNWVPAPYDYDFAFSIASFSDGISDVLQLIGSGVWMAIGAVTFTATYNNAPGGMTAAVALSGSAVAWAGNLAMTPVTGPETNTEAVQYPSGRTGTITFTLSQSVDGTTDTEQVAFSNTMRYGTNANGSGSQTEANVEALTEVPGPDESRSQTINNIPAGTAGHFLTFAYADALSDVAQVQMDSGFGFVTASFNPTATTLAPAVQTSGLTTVQNSAGFVEAFAAITSRLADLPNGSRDFKLLTTSTALNYILWGELNKASGYTEADVENNIATQPGKVASNSMSSRSMIVNCAAGEYVYIAYPARLGALTSIIIGGFESLGDFTVDNTALAVTNDAGYTENYRVYVSDNPSFIDPTTMLVTI